MELEEKLIFGDEIGEEKKTTFAMELEKKLLMALTILLSFAMEWRYFHQSLKPCKNKKDIVSDP